MAQQDADVLLMLITKDFVMLNYPKTGSSFAREIIKQAYRHRTNIFHRAFIKLGFCAELMAEHYVVNQQVNITDQHGKLTDIPAEHRDKRIVSIIRCPLDRYISQYTYRWWVKHPPAPYDQISQQYPHFPELSFSEFYEINWRYVLPKRLANLALPEIEVGTQTLQFIEFFFANPQEAARRILLERDSSYLQQLKAITFLHQENLNAELKAFLHATTGIASKNLAFIDEQQPINVSRDKAANIDIIPPQLREQIKRRDWLLFELFPEYDV